MTPGTPVLLPHRLLPQIPAASAAFAVECSASLPKRVSVLFNPLELSAQLADSVKAVPLIVLMSLRHLCGSCTAQLELIVTADLLLVQLLRRLNCNTGSRNH